MSNRNPKLCIHGGNYDECQGQCKVSVEIEEFNGVLFCGKCKGHDGSHRIAVKAVLRIA